MKPKKRLFISSKLPLDAPSALEIYDWQQWQEDRRPTPKELLHHTRNAHRLISVLSDPLDRHFLSQCPHLEAIAQYAVGLNNIDLDYCKEKNITVTNTPDVLTKASAHHAMALFLTLARQIPQAQKNAKSGQWIQWEPSGFLGLDLEGIQVGIIGFGRIGQEFARLMSKAFNAKVSTLEREKNKPHNLDFHIDYLSMKQLLQTSQVISLHTPLNSSTQQLIQKKEFDLMKDDVIFINTARGEIVDQDDLQDFLNQGRGFGVGLDVTTPEPLPPEHPLFAIDRVLITPHIASAERETRIKMAKIVYQNICL
jgi:glyoxylate reductase